MAKSDAPAVPEITSVEEAPLPALPEPPPAETVPKLLADMFDPAVELVGRKVRVLGAIHGTVVATERHPHGVMVVVDPGDGEITRQHAGNIRAFED